MTATIHPRCGQLDDPARDMRCPCHNPKHAALIRRQADARRERARKWRSSSGAEPARPHSPVSGAATNRPRGIPH